jgi:hypothetical protein
LRWWRRARRWGVRRGRGGWPRRTRAAKRKRGGRWRAGWRWWASKGQRRERQHVDAGQPCDGPASACMWEGWVVLGWVPRCSCMVAAWPSRCWWRPTTQNTSKVPTQRQPAAVAALQAVRQDLPHPHTCSPAGAGGALPTTTGSDQNTTTGLWGGVPGGLQQQVVVRRWIEAAGSVQLANLPPASPRKDDRQEATPPLTHTPSIQPFKRLAFEP